MKLLGVDIDFNLGFGSHIQNICKKAGKQLNVLRRIGKNLCKLSRMTIFHSFEISISIFVHFHGISAPKQIQIKLKNPRESTHVRLR